MKKLLRLFGETPFSRHAHGGVKSIKTSLQNVIKTHQGINAPTATKHLAISLRTTQRYLKELSEEGSIVFKGAPKNGGYFAKSAFPENV
ncbi:MAG: hypothetical protein WCP12_01280 [bacterium]